MSVCELVVNLPPRLINRWEGTRQTPEEFLEVNSERTIFLNLYEDSCGDKFPYQEVIRLRTEGKDSKSKFPSQIYMPEPELLLFFPQFDPMYQSVHALLITQGVVFDNPLAFITMDGVMHWDISRNFSDPVSRVRLREGLVSLPQATVQDQAAIEQHYQRIADIRKKFLER